MKKRIRLRGISGIVEGKVWESDTLLRTGRLSTLEVVLEDSSVSRRHAEVRATPKGWVVRDLGSTNGTFVNGARLGQEEKQLKDHDILRCGNITWIADLIQDEVKPPSSEHLLVEATNTATWEDAFQGIIFDREHSPRPGEQLVALLRAGHHLVHLEKVEDLLETILNDAVRTLDAQRGAIVLAEKPDGPLQLRALACSNSTVPARPSYSQNLAQRCFGKGESILCTRVEDDPELLGSRSIAEGAMSSVLCVLLRTPRKRLGVLHLDRSHMQKPFTKDDLYLADALAAHVSAGIESAHLLRKQKELFLSTINILAQAVEMRDHYTGNHTKRVTTYSLLLGQQLNLPAEDINHLRVGTPLHDIGKIGIDDDILRKPGKLTPEEFEIMKTHTTKGAKILEQIPELASIVPIARSHHERWDGKGYPDGLRGEGIPRLARIVAVADAFDAMTSNRPYRKGMPAELAFAEMEKQSARQFDPELAQAFLGIKDRILLEMQNDSSTPVPTSVPVTTATPLRIAN